MYMYEVGVSIFEGMDHGHGEHGVPWTQGQQQQMRLVGLDHLHPRNLPCVYQPRSDKLKRF